MTKNEDTSPWMHFPDDPKAIKRHNKLVLSSIPTADLVTELKGRHEPDSLPSWAIEAINERLKRLEYDQLYHRISELEWVLSLRKPEGKE